MARSWRDPSEATLALVLLAPAFLLLALIVVFPVGRLLITSLYDLSLTSGLPARFVGLENFSLVWDDPSFWNALTNTLLLVMFTVPGAMVAGMGLALVANMPFRHKWPVRLALLIPWALPLAFVGLIAGWFFQSDYGIVNDVLSPFMAQKIIWVNSPNLAFAAMTMAIIWKTSSFVAMILLAGLQSIPSDVYEAARVDGASKWQQFWQVTLPLLRPSIVVAAIFRTITALQTFDIPATMTKGGPGDATSTLAMYIHQTTVDFLDLGYGSALAVVMFILSMVISTIYLRHLKSVA